MIYQLMTLLLIPLTLTSPTDNYNNIVDNDLFDQKFVVSSMGMTTWPVKACQGPPSDTHTRLVYGSDHPENIASFTLTRDMYSREQLDMLGSIPGTPGACTQFLYSEAYETRGGNPPICYNTKVPATCFHWKRNVTLDGKGCIRGQICPGEQV